MIDLFLMLFNLWSWPMPEAEILKGISVDNEYNIEMKMVVCWYRV